MDIEGSNEEDMWDIRRNRTRGSWTTGLGSKGTPGNNGLKILLFKDPYYPSEINGQCIWFVIKPTYPKAQRN